MGDASRAALAATMRRIAGAVRAHPGVVLAAVLDDDHSRDLEALMFVVEFVADQAARDAALAEVDLVGIRDRISAEHPAWTFGGGDWVQPGGFMLYWLHRRVEPRVRRGRRASGARWG